MHLKTQYACVYTQYSLLLLKHQNCIYSRYQLKLFTTNCNLLNNLLAECKNNISINVDLRSFAVFMLV